MNTPRNTIPPDHIIHKVCTDPDDPMTDNDIAKRVNQMVGGWQYDPPTLKAFWAADSYLMYMKDPERQERALTTLNQWYLEYRRQQTNLDQGLFYPLYTVGYMSWGLEGFGDLKVQINGFWGWLVDIRNDPDSSHYPEYTQVNLKRHFGWRYHWCKSLTSIPVGEGIRDMISGYYQLRSLLATRPVILLCSCASAEHCHRDKIVTYVSDNLGVTGRHLYPDSEIKEGDFEQLPLLNLTQPQPF